MVRTARLVAVALVLAAVCLVSYAQTTPLVSWNPEAPLTWDLFQGTPPGNAASLSEPAMVSIDIKWYANHSYDYRYGRRPAWIATATDVVVSNVLNPKLSWALHSKTTPALLVHEQGHFDLSEIYCRKLAMSFATLRAEGSNSEEVKAALNNLLYSAAQTILTQAEAIQNQYDAETSFGRDGAEQARWNELIRTWLEQPMSAP